MDRVDLTHGGEEREKGEEGRKERGNAKREFDY